MCAERRTGRARPGHRVRRACCGAPPARAFALRFDGQVVAYMNRCAHVPTEMDWQAGEFLDMDKRWILCSIHGAAYEPADGRCVGGPCGRGRLMPIDDRRARRARCIGILPATSNPSSSTTRGRAMARPLKAHHESARTVSAFVDPAARRCTAGARAGCRRAGRRASNAAWRGSRDELLRERRADRRWRVFFRLAWLILFVVIAWALLASARPSAARRRGPHTALVEVRGEIAADSEASAENLVAALKGAFEDAERAGRGAAHQQPGRQPGAGRHRQRRDQAPEGQAQEAGVRGGRGDVRLGRLLHRGGRRRDLRRQGQPGRLDRRADGRLRLRRRDGKARHRAAPAHRRREQGHARSVLAAEREAARPMRRR